MLETCADLTRVQAAVGFAPKIPLEEGLRQFVAWFDRYYYNNGAGEAAGAATADQAAQPTPGSPASS
jgi:hypothetical protein